MSPAFKTKLILAGVIWGSFGLLMLHDAKAEGFDAQTTCYTWNGGDKSSGGFAKCDTWVVAEKKVAPPPPTPVMMPVVPMQSCPPPEPKATKHFIKRKPRVECK